MQSWAPMVRNTDHDDDEDEVADGGRDGDGDGRDDDAFHDDHLGQVADDIDGTFIGISRLTLLTGGWP